MEHDERSDCGVRVMFLGPRFADAGIDDFLAPAGKAEGARERAEAAARDPR
jgi:hypothetical protein